MSTAEFAAFSDNAIMFASIVYVLAFLAHLAEWVFLRSVPVPVAEPESALVGAPSTPRCWQLRYRGGSGRPGHVGGRRGAGRAVGTDRAGADGARLRPAPPGAGHPRPGQRPGRVPWGNMYEFTLAGTPSASISTTANCHGVNGTDRGSAATNAQQADDVDRRSRRACPPARRGRAGARRVTALAVEPGHRGLTIDDRDEAVCHRTDRLPARVLDRGQRTAVARNVTRPATTPTDQSGIEPQHVEAEVEVLPELLLGVRARSRCEPWMAATSLAGAPPRSLVAGTDQRCGAS